MRLEEGLKIGVVGLTGGIATGKTTVSGMFSELGVPIIDADKLAREVVKPGRQALDEIIDLFGEQILTSEKKLDRQKLGEIVFDDDEARKQVESITHPAIAREMRQRVVDLAEDGVKWCIYDAALLVETGSHELMDRVIVVTAHRETQMKRLMKRDGLSRAEALDRFNSQADQESKKQFADYIIDNNGTISQTRRQVEEIFDDLRCVFA